MRAAYQTWRIGVVSGLAGMLPRVSNMTPLLKVAGRKGAPARVGARQTRSGRLTRAGAPPPPRFSVQQGCSRLRARRPGRVAHPVHGSPGRRASSFSSATLASRHCSRPTSHSRKRLGVLSARMWSEGHPITGPRAPPQRSARRQAPGESRATGGTTADRIRASDAVAWAREILARYEELNDLGTTEPTLAGPDTQNAPSG